MTNLAATLARLDGVAQAELVASGELTARDLLDAFAERYEAMNPLLRAVVTVDLDRARNTTPATGPFTGVPLLLKDVLAHAGMRWSFGSRAFARNIAPTSPPYARALEASGLVVVGKTAMSEFGLLGSTETLLEGITHNPWDLSRSAAGSSGGAAAAVAGGLVPFAHANDGGGSVRVPASACGLFGFIPSRGRTQPAMLASSDFADLTIDHFVSRTVRDSAMLLSITEDPHGSWPAVGYVREPSKARLRIGAQTRTLLGGQPEPAVRAAHEDVVALVSSLGHRVEEVTFPEVDGAAIRDAFFIVAGAAVAGIADMLAGMGVSRPAFEPFTAQLAEAFRAAGPDALTRARESFGAASRAWRAATQSFDVILTPTLATLPWKLGHLSPTLSRATLIARTEQSVCYTPIHNVVGCPAMSVPLSWSQEGLPIGAHFAGKIGQENVLLALAYELEQARPWRDRWAPFSYPTLFG